MSNNDVPWPQSHIQHSWAACADPEGDGPRPQIHDFGAPQGCKRGCGSEWVANSTLGQVSFGPNSWNLWEPLPWHEVSNQSYSHASYPGWSHGIRDSGRRRASSYEPETPLYPFNPGVYRPVEFDHGSLSPYLGLDGHRRAYSDAASACNTQHSRLLSPTAPTPKMSAQLEYWWPEVSDDSIHSNHSETRSGLWSDASSQWLSPSSSVNFSPETHFTCLPNADRSPELPAVVLKQNVGSTRTRNASRNRRRQGAKYGCPVSGCESTFTRRDNLNGHLRAHSDERPYVCRWTACGRAFARLHDCKRHEQLHTIDPSFACAGCKKKFGRLDALNRHLRSRGAAQCRRAHKGDKKFPEDSTAQRPVVQERLPPSELGSSGTLGWQTLGVDMRGVTL